MDPNQGIYSILNVSRISKFLAKKLILEYSKYFQQSKTFNTLFFIDENFDIDLLNNFKSYFTKLSYDQENMEFVDKISKDYFKKFTQGNLLFTNIDL